MMRNAELFKGYLDKNNLYADTWSEGEKTFFQFQQKLKSGPAGRLLVIFGGDTLVSVYALDYVSLSNTARKDYMYRVLNDLNMKYTYHKFLLDQDNNIMTSSFIPFSNNFSEEVVMELLFGSLNVMEEEYATLMKAMWS
ncbi:YbjN domain-containing protein [Clostridium omnivorum]|nr:YbjN domain-containing protein [Clostridium sp. E14]